jgi:hypothetical protein
MILVLGGLGFIATPQEQNIEINKINVTLSKLIFEDEGKYIKINLEGTNGFLIEPGKPVLPCYRKTFKFPVGTIIEDIKVFIEEKEKIKLEKDILITPEPVQINKLLNNYQLQKSTNLTNTYPESDYFYRLGRGLDNEEPTLFLTIQVNPCSYNPFEKTITFGSKITISVQHKKGSGTFNDNEVFNFLIVTEPSFADELVPLMIHKEDRGVSTKIVNYNEINLGIYFPNEGRDKLEEIKYFIKNAYEKWGTRNVLIVGEEEIPGRRVYISILNEEDPEDSDNELFLSDLYFADLYDGKGNFSSWDTNGNNIYGEINQELGNDIMDLYPDVRLGRFVCTDEEQVTTVVNKIINYENTEAWTQNWFNNVTLIGGDTVPEHYGDESGIDEGEFVNQAVIEIMNGFIPNKIWATNGKLGSINPTGVDQINSAINNGCGFIDWSGHGSPQVWTTFPHNGKRQSLPSPFGAYTKADINDLKSSEKLPIVMCGGCSLGKYEKDKNCFAWSYLANPNGGGIASFGASALGYIYLGQWATFGLIEGLMLRFYEAYYDNAFTLGEIWSDAYNDYLNDIIFDPEINFGEVDYKTLTEMHMFGDPTLQLRSDSLPPEKPINLEGPKDDLKTGKKYTFTSSTIDPNDDQIYYLFDWGDGTYSLWLGPYESGAPVEANKIWDEYGEYEIRVKAKDIYGVQSDWSDPFSITILKNKAFNFIKIFELIILRFPFFEKILY